MGKSDEARLLALLEDIDWTTAPAVDDTFHVRDRLCTVLAAYARMALAKSRTEAYGEWEAIEGGSETPAFAAWPVQGADVLIRLISEATPDGIACLLANLRATTDELVAMDEYPDTLVDEYASFVLARRAVIDQVIGDDVDRLRSAAEVATLIEADAWKAELAIAAGALGASDVLHRLTGSPKLTKSAVFFKRQRLSGIFGIMGGPSQRPGGAGGTGPLHVVWRRGLSLRGGVLTRASVYSSTGWRSVFWYCELRSDRRSLAATLANVRQDIELAGMPADARPPGWREVVVRGWIGDELKEVRYRWRDPIEPFMGARHWSEFLALVEPPRR